MDLSADGGLQDGLIDDGVVQEIDIKTGLVMFQWHALGHVADRRHLHARPARAPATCSTTSTSTRSTRCPDGDLLISSRNTWAAYLISTRDRRGRLAAGRQEEQLHARRRASASPGSTTPSCCPTARSACSTTRPRRPRPRSRARSTSPLNPARTRRARAPAHLPRAGHPLRQPGRRAAALQRRRVRRLGAGRRGVRVLAGRRAHLRHAPRRAREQLSRLPPVWSGAAARRSRRSRRPPRGTDAPSCSRAGTARPTSPAGACSPAARAGTLQRVGSYAARGFETAIAAPTAAPYVRVQALSRRPAAAHLAGRRRQGALARRARASLSSGRCGRLPRSVIACFYHW